MGSFTAQQFVQENEKQQQFYREQISRFDAILDDQRTKINELHARKQAALESIASFLLPDLSDESFSKLSQQIKSPQVSALAQEMERERAELTAMIAQIESDDQYKKREALTDPNSGVLPTQIQEIEPLYTKALATRKKIEGMNRFMELKQRGYGTSSYPHKGIFRFFNSEYNKDWKAADQIVEAMGVSDFVDVLSMYSEAVQQSDTFGEELADYRQQLNRITKLVQEHEAAKSGIANLEHKYRSEAGDRILRYLKNADANSVSQLLQGHPDLENMYKQLDGLEHQTEYLEQLATQVTGERNKIVEKATTLSAESQRYQSDPHRYRNKRFTDDQFARKFRRDEERYDKMFNRYNRTGNTIYVFNDYNRGSYMEDFLWWDLMTDGRIDGNFIPEVQEYYSAHPDYVYDRDMYQDPDAVTDYGDNS